MSCLYCNNAEAPPIPIEGCIIAFEGTEKLWYYFFTYLSTTTQINAQLWVSITIVLTDIRWNNKLPCRFTYKAIIVFGTGIVANTMLRFRFLKHIRCSDTIPINRPITNNQRILISCSHISIHVHISHYD